MKKEIANLWVGALRSGNYKPGKYFLRSIDNLFCPLGVLCELAVQQKGVNRELDKESFMYEGNRAAVPERVMIWSGLRNPNGFTPQVNKSISTMADNGASFEEIAKLIEKNWETL